MSLATMETLAKSDNSSISVSSSLHSIKKLKKKEMKTEQTQTREKWKSLSKTR